MPANNTQCPECGAPITGCYEQIYREIILGADGDWHNGPLIEDVENKAIFNCPACEYEWTDWASNE